MAQCWYQWHSVAQCLPIDFFLSWVILCLLCLVVGKICPWLISCGLLLRGPIFLSMRQISTTIAYGEYHVIYCSMLPRVSVGRMNTTSVPTSTHTTPLTDDQSHRTSIDWHHGPTCCPLTEVIKRNWLYWLTWYSIDPKTTSEWIKHSHLDGII